MDGEIQLINGGVLLADVVDGIAAMIEEAGGNEGTADPGDKGVGRYDSISNGRF